MHRTPLLLALTASAALAGCNRNNDHTIVVGPGGVEENGTNAAETNLADVTLPPSILKSNTYRCRDNSVVYVDWLSDGTARVRAGETQVGETVQVGDGGPISGTPDAPSITYKGQSCKA